MMLHKQEPGCIKMNYYSAPIGSYIDSKSLEHRIAFALCDEVQRIVVSEDIRADAFGALYVQIEIGQGVGGD